VSLEACELNGRASLSNRQLLFVSKNKLLFELAIKPAADKLGLHAIFYNNNSLRSLETTNQNADVALAVLDITDWSRIIDRHSGYLLPTVKNVPLVALVSRDISINECGQLLASGVLSIVDTEVSPGAVSLILELALLGERYVPARLTVYDRINISDSFRNHRKNFFGEKIKPLSDPGRLTRTEAMILALVAIGKSNKEIAYEVSRAETTVKMHIGRMMKRFGVNNRTKLSLISMSSSNDNPSRIPARDLGSIIAD
jgi:DNA-binding NarL/FixJ family response regulator